MIIKSFKSSLMASSLLSRLFLCGRQLNEYKTYGFAAFECRLHQTTYTGVSGPSKSVDFHNTLPTSVENPFGKC